MGCYVMLCYSLIYHSKLAFPLGGYESIHSGLPIRVGVGSCSLCHKMK